MKISMTSEELKALVEKEVSSMGFSGSFNIEFKPRRDGNVETEIDILPVGAKDKVETTSCEPQNDDCAEEAPTTKY